MVLRSLLARKESVESEISVRASSLVITVTYVLLSCLRRPGLCVEINSRAVKEPATFAIVESGGVSTRNYFAIRTLRVCRGC